MCNAWNHPPGCRCGFGGEGHLGRSPGPPYGGRDTPSVHLFLGQRAYKWIHEGSITFLTKCWWCPKYVYFYRNENGGCALFDELGYPWPIHPCWEKHRTHHEYAIHAIVKEHIHLLISDTYVFPSATAESTFPDGTAVAIRCHLHMPTNRVEVVDTRKHGQFAKIIICGTDMRTYDVYVPLLWYAVLRTSPFFEIHAVAWRRGAKTDFFAQTVTVTKDDGSCTTLSGVADTQSVLNDQWYHHDMSASQLSKKKQKHRHKRGKRREKGKKSKQTDQRKKRETFGLFADPKTYEKVRRKILGESDGEQGGGPLR